MEELAGTGSVALEALGGERTCQEAIRTLRATAALAELGLAVAALDVAVECVPGVGRLPPVPGCLDRGPAQRGGPALETRPVCELWPDCLTRGAKPA